jgi:hypothetical protein
MRLVRASAAFVLAGLFVETISLRWNHPLAFLLFAIIGGAGIVIGVLLYLYWLFFRREASS